MTDFIYDPRGPVNLGLRRAPPGMAHFWSYYDRGLWEPRTRNVLARFAKPGAWLLDIGAWIGPVTMWANDLGYDAVCVEPDPVAMTLLLENTAGPSGNIYVSAAISDKDSLAQLTNYESTFGNSMSRLGDPSMVSRSLLVPAMTATRLFSMFASLELALVKLDIEGGELDIIEDLADLCFSRKVPLFVSWHEPWWHSVPSMEQRLEWFDGFDLEGGLGNWDTLLAIPKGYRHD